MSITNQVRKFILANYLFTEDESAIADSQSLLDSGILDSTGVLELISFIEDQFAIKVADEEMVPENLDSVTSITEYVQRKQR